MSASVTVRWKAGAAWEAPKAISSRTSEITAAVANSTLPKRQSAKRFMLHSLAIGAPGEKALGPPQ